MDSMGRMLPILMKEFTDQVTKTLREEASKSRQTTRLVSKQLLEGQAVSSSSEIQARIVFYDADTKTKDEQTEVLKKVEEDLSVSFRALNKTIDDDKSSEEEEQEKKSG